MQEWSSWRPVWKLSVCWPFRRGPGRLRSSCRTQFTSTWDRYAASLASVRVVTRSLAVRPGVLSHSCCCDVWAEGCCTQILGVPHDGTLSGLHSLLPMSLWCCQLLRMATLTSVCCGTTCHIGSRPLSWGGGEKTGELPWWITFSFLWPAVHMAAT